MQITPPSLENSVNDFWDPITKLVIHRGNMPQCHFIKLNSAQKELIRLQPIKNKTVLRIHKIPLELNT
jgi:hypothetical protein